MSGTIKLTIIKPGLHTTVQDQGRQSCQAFGIPVSGPLDRESARKANLMLGNPRSNPVLEFTMIGPEVLLEGKGSLALTGGQFESRLDLNPLSTYQVYPVNGTLRLSIGRALSGCRGYLAVAGNWKLTPWLGSCSTAAQNPGLLTPASDIRKGSIIEVEQSGQVSFPGVTARVEPDASPMIRIIAGPEYDRFNTETIKEFLAGQFTISPESNRMGYRLDPLLKNYTDPAEIISTGVVPGTIQITHAGQLIVLMNDAQTTGGYPRIANVISADLSKLGQKAPGHPVQFKLISLREAHGLADLAG